MVNSSEAGGEFKYYNLLFRQHGGLYSTKLHIKTLKKYRDVLNRADVWNDVSEQLGVPGQRYFLRVS
jgi:hypothetical protein